MINTIFDLTSNQPSSTPQYQYQYVPNEINHLINIHEEQKREFAEVREQNEELQENIKKLIYLSEEQKKESSEIQNQNRKLNENINNVLQDTNRLIEELSSATREREELKVDIDNISDRVITLQDHLHIACNQRVLPSDDYRKRPFFVVTEIFKNNYKATCRQQKTLQSALEKIQAEYPRSKEIYRIEHPNPRTFYSSLIKVLKRKCCITNKHNDFSSTNLSINKLISTIKELEANRKKIEGNTY